MRLVAKIFLSVMAVFSVAFLAAGYFLLSHSLEISVERELEFALRQYQFDKFSVQADLIANEEEFQALLEDENRNPEWFLRELSRGMEEPICLIAEDGRVLYSGSSAFDDLPFDGLAGGETKYQVVNEDGSCYILVGGRIAREEGDLDFITKTDITPVIEQQAVLKRYFLNCLLLAMAAAMVLVFVISTLLTRPLAKMAGAANRIADGNYHERLAIRQKGEVGELAESFNRMTVAVEDKVRELEQEVQRKEDFVANFAHELKTPMTSVIGYADMLYQKDLPRSEVKDAAWYIWNEGMRLEAMALKMMDLTVLNHQEIPLVDVPADEFLQDAVSGLEPALQAEGIRLTCRAQSGYVKMDYDLMKTVLLNLIDNARKAESSQIVLAGVCSGADYCISVSDDGTGIPGEELSRITEAFYMVDKSRSRKQHGAGLGLSLVSRIVELHQGELRIESTPGKGTRVSVILPAYRELEEAPEREEGREDG